MSMATASQLERLFACPGSAALPQVQSSGAAADRGSAVHLYLERIGTGMDPDEALELVEDDHHRSLCASIELDRLPRGTAPEVAFAYNPAARAARELGRRLGRAYPPLCPGEIPGTADAVGISESHAFIGDYKTGHVVAGARESAQLRFLALCAARVYDRDRVLVEMIRIRENGGVWRDRAELDALDLDAFEVELGEMAARVRAAQRLFQDRVMPDVVEGEHCRYCPAWDACPAKATALVRVATGEALEPLASLLPLTPEMAGHAWTKLRGARRLLERLERGCYAALDEYGELPLPSGGILRRVTEPGNEVLDGRVMFAVVREHLDQAAAEDAIEIHASKAGLGRALRAAADGGKIPPRGRAAAERKILATVRDRGGVSKPPVTRVVEVEADSRQQRAPSASAALPQQPSPGPTPAGPTLAHLVRGFYEALETVLQTPEFLSPLRSRIEALPDDSPDKVVLLKQLVRVERLAREEAAAKEDGDV